MSGIGTVAKLIAGVGQAVLPLRSALESPEQFTALLLRLGWRATEIPAPVRDLGARLDRVYDSLVRLIGEGGLHVGSSPGGDPVIDASAGNIAQAVTAVNELVGAIHGLASAPATAYPPDLVAAGFREMFPRQLIDHLLVDYLVRRQPRIGFALRTLGVIRSEYQAASGVRPGYMARRFDLAALPMVVTDPGQLLRNTFGWGTSDFDFAAFASQVDNLLVSLGSQVSQRALTAGEAGTVQGTPRDRPTALEIRPFSRVIGDDPDKMLAAAIRLLELPGTPTQPAGLALVPSFEGVLGFTLPLSEDIDLTVRSDLDFSGGVAALIRPGQGIEILTGFEGEGPAPTKVGGSFEAIVERKAADGQPTVLFGEPDGTRLQYQKLSGAGGLRLGSGGPDVFGEVSLDGLKFVFKPAGADGFIGAVLPKDGVQIDADVTVGLSRQEGLYFRGSAGLELQIPVHLRIGPVEVQALTLSVGAGSEGVPVGVGTTFKAAFGPLQAVVEDIGVTANFAVRANGDGNLGPLDVAFGFKPPKGVGLSVDAGVISGGGYLSFDPDKGEYAGALELEFANFLELKAIGLISTKKPDGSDGFSLLIVIATEFGGGGIQLGYGFTLLAVGGLVGLNRGMNLDALAQGVRSGAIESVMFPKDVVANAPRILSDLRTFFPAEDGKFLIGPMAKIGWGTPTIVSVSLGVIIEIPGNIAIVGVLKCLLPTKELPLLVLQVNFAGAIEFDKSRLWFFAELFESRILFMSIEGGIGLLVGWGDDAELVLTVGGFHPAFQPPALPFPVPRRLAIDILNQAAAKIRVEGYFAITSNSVQFGAHAELTLGFDDFGIHGHLGFDALFRFSPFAFVIEVEAGVSLKAFGVGLFGIDLHFVLEGPAPFRAHGRGSISLLFFEISADFDISWGEEHNTVLPPVDVLPLLASEIGKVEGWRTQLPTGGTKPLVTLRQLDPTEDLVLHPMGTLTVQQRAIPLGVRLDRVGQQTPRDGNRFTVEPAPDSGLVQVAATDDQFAMAQYQTMDDATKLSRPAYERQDAGIEVTAEQSATEIARSRFVRRSSRYELRILDNKRKPTPRRTEPLATVGAAAKPKSKYYEPDPVVFNQLLAGNSISTSPLSQQRAKQLQPFDDSVKIPGRRYVVAHSRDNSQAFAPGSTATSFRSASAATDAMSDWVGKDPRLADKLHVIPVDEAHGTPPVPERWSSAGTLPVTTAGSPMVALNNGKALYAGGTTPDGGPTRSGGLFEVDTATWTAPGDLTVARTGHTLTTLLNGRALAVGGIGTETSAEIFDPVTNTWSAVPAPLTAGRSGHTATRLKSGLVLVAGGNSADGRALASAELFDPATRKWTPVGAMSEARTDHQAVLIGEQVLVIGGRRPTGGGQSAPLAFCEIFNPADKTWTVTGDLTVPRSGHQATVLGDDGAVLVTGGDASGVAVARRFDPASQRTAEVYRDGVWKRVKDLPTGRSDHHSIRIASGEVVVIGGSTGPAHDAGFRSVLVYHPAKDTWRSTGPLGTGRTDFAAALLPDGRLLVAGGIERSTVSVSTAELFTP